MVENRQRLRKKTHESKNRQVTRGKGRIEALRENRTYEKRNTGPWGRNKMGNQITRRCSIRHRRYTTSGLGKGDQGDR